MTDTPTTTVSAAHGQNVAAEQVKLILAELLIRAGYWVSLCDMEGGKRTAQAEKQAVRRLIFSQHKQERPGEIRDILEIIVKHEEMWTLNLAVVPNFLDDVRLYLDRMSPRYRDVLFQVAFTAAVACQERGEWQVFKERVRMFFRELMGRKGSFISRRDYMNISTLEKHALNELAEALGLAHRRIK